MVNHFQVLPVLYTSRPTVLGDMSLCYDDTAMSLFAMFLQRVVVADVNSAHKRTAVGGAMFVARKLTSPSEQHGRQVSAVLLYSML
jgi:hypothetical protein